jgi:hypothetical protein
MLSLLRRMLTIASEIRLPLTASKIPTLWS